MTPPHLLGIDLGTSSTKTTIIDSDGRLISIAAQEYAFDTPKPGWAEQNPEIWFQAAVNTMRLALRNSNISPEDITAIGLTGLMHGPVCLDSQGQPLGPSIIWADQRTSEQVRLVYNKIGVAQLGQWTGNPLATGFTLATWLWLREHEPDIYNRIAYLLLPKDYIRYRLTGEIGTEPSDASGTSIFNPMTGRWSTSLLEALGLPTDPLPPCYPSHNIAGALLPRIAEQTGLRSGTPVVYGGSDQTCQAIGNGIIEPGTISCTIGTGGQIFAVTKRPVYDPDLRLHLFCHVVPDTWHMLAATLTAGKSLRWLRDNVFQGFGYRELVDQADQVAPGSEGLFFLPYLAGERTPHMDPEASGAFIGLSLRHNRADLVRAVLEGVVMSLRQGLEVMMDLGLPVDRIVASGGATNHPLWLQLQADIFNRPIYRTQTREAAAVGAGILAGVGTGVYQHIPEACQRTVRLDEVIIQPDPETVETYNQKFQTFTQLYPSIKTGFG
jgi:xylulokinase